MKRIYVKAIGMKNYRGELCPNAQEILEKHKVESRDYFCTPTSERRYEVDFGDARNMVELSKNTCSCRYWDLTGIP